MTTFHPRVLSSGILFTTYQYIYNHYCLHPLAWHSTSTWILAAIGIDFCYYWVHRAAHGEQNNQQIFLNCLSVCRDKPPVGSSPGSPLLRGVQSHHRPSPVSFPELWQRGKKADYDDDDDRVSTIFVFFQPFYLPLALFIPPSQALVHKELNLLYQFWIHTELVTNLGPLELILNTASHHRVHHGANRYCLDKNYAGFLIIWDRSD